MKELEEYGAVKLAGGAITGTNGLIFGLGQTAENTCNLSTCRNARILVIRCERSEGGFAVIVKACSTFHSIYKPWTIRPKKMPRQSKRPKTYPGALSRAKQGREKETSRTSAKTSHRVLLEGLLQPMRQGS